MKHPHPCRRSALTLLGLSVFVLLLAGCGGSPGTPSSPGCTGSCPIAGENTTVALQLSSTANGQFLQFNMEIDSISLTNQAGKTTTIYNTPANVGFIASNGEATPFITVSVPQDIYTSAAVSVLSPFFSYLSMDSSGGVGYNSYEYGYTPTPPVVILAEPITVSGSTMGLTLNLQATPSGSFTQVPPPGISPFVINPTFDLTPFAIPEQSTTPQNGKCLGLTGRITGINPVAGTMDVALASDGMDHQVGTTIQLMPGATFTADFNSSTQWQGISSASGLSVGTFVNLDVALQPDASYLATRVEVQDATTTNLTTGLIMQADPSFHYIQVAETRQQGDFLQTYPLGVGEPYVYASSTNFQTSAQFPNLSSLPFTAVFNSSILAAGQMISVGADTFAVIGGQYTLPTSITLVPQTINGVVQAVSSAGSYTVYTVRLAPYDPIVQMNSPAGAAVDTLLPNANQINVYVNSSASLLNATPLGLGSTFRFHGLLFNDAGVFRMVCDQINDGVAQ